MSKLPSHVEDELLELLCPNAIVLRSKVSNGNILVKDGFLSKVKKENIDLLNKRKEEMRELQNKLKKCPVLHMKVKKENIGPT
jgi:tRNA(Phe) wybutosine-synthesizing methylase Tyw3